MATMAAKHIKCSVCDMIVRPQGARPGKLPDLEAEPPKWNHRVMIDEFEVVLSDGTPWQLLGILDKASRYFAAWPLVKRSRGSATATQITSAFENAWMHWAISPSLWRATH